MGLWVGRHYEMTPDWPDPPWTPLERFAKIDRNPLDYAALNWGTHRKNPQTRRSIASAKNPLRKRELSARAMLCLVKEEMEGFEHGISTKVFR